jgi:hypothetical protein
LSNYRTMKLAGTSWSLILTVTSLAIPSRNRNDWSTSCSCKYVGHKGLSWNKCLYVTVDMMLTLELMSQNIL